MIAQLLICFTILTSARAQDPPRSYEPVIEAEGIVKSFNDQFVRFQLSDGSIVKLERKLLVRNLRSQQKIRIQIPISKWPLG